MIKIDHPQKVTVYGNSGKKEEPRLRSQLALIRIDPTGTGCNVKDLRPTELGRAGVHFFDGEHTGLVVHPKQVNNPPHNIRGLDTVVIRLPRLGTSAVARQHGTSFHTLFSLPNTYRGAPVYVDYGKKNYQLVGLLSQVETSSPGDGRTIHPPHFVHLAIGNLHSVVAKEIAAREKAGREKREKAARKQRR